MEALLLAARPVLAPAFTLWGSPVTWLEIVAVVLSLAMVAANLRVHPVGWPLAIAASLLYALLFADARLYGEAALQFLFVALAAWGWWQWVRTPRADTNLQIDNTAEPPSPPLPLSSTLRVHRLAARQAWTALLATLVAWPLMALLLARLTDSDVPALDALATVGSVTGQVLLGRKLLENWAVWLAVNVFSVGLFSYKGLWLTAALYALFAVLSWVGWRAWQRHLRQGTA